METQELLFQQIKSVLPEHLSLVDIISDLLAISYDSAYRRIRGEKELSISELDKISKRFGLSIDTLFNIQTNNVIFKHNPISSPSLGVKQWLKTILTDLQHIKESSIKEIIYAAKDPPIFHYFQFPEIGAFKMFFWEKTIFQFPQHADKKFNLKYQDNEIGKIGEQILRLSLKIPTTEIWNEDTFIITFKQIENYWISGLFEKKEDIHLLCDKLRLWITHIKKQAEFGYKFLYGSEATGVEGSYKLFENEVVLNDNTILVKTNNYSATYLTYNVLSILLTSDQKFCEGVENYFKGILKESILISSVNAKERNRFFNNFLNKIDQFQERIG